LLDYHPVPDGFAVKFRPIHYPLTGKHSEVYIEATYTLVGNALKCVYKYTSFRTDSQIDTSFGFNGWGIPACFLNNQLTRYKIYTGSNPFSTEPLTEGLIPTSGTCATPITFSTKEYWGMVFNPTTGIGFGVYNASEGGNTVDIIFKQCQVSSANPPGTEFAGGFTFMQPNITLSNSATSGSFVKTSTAYITVGTEAENRSTFNIIRQL
jgi:hypothetical protein